MNKEVIIQKINSLNRELDYVKKEKIADVDVVLNLLRDCFETTEPEEIEKIIREREGGNYFINSVEILAIARIYKAVSNFDVLYHHKIDTSKLE